MSMPFQLIIVKLEQTLMKIEVIKIFSSKNKMKWLSYKKIRHQSFKWFGYKIVKKQNLKNGEIFIQILFSDNIIVGQNQALN